MKRKDVLFLLLIFAATFAACSKGGGGSTPNVEPSITPVGTNDGTAVTKTIGSAGGSIVSDDGEVELIIPSGALSANTDITIQPITNDIPSGHGVAYRFTPNGQQFAKDVTIKFHYTEEDVAATKPEYMQVAFQNADGSWQVVDKVTNDQAANTINASVNHFTDFTQFDILRLVPASLFLKPGESGQFEISYAGMTTNNIIAFGTQLLQTPGVWKVNGVTGGNTASGTIQSTAPVRATYKAPATAPAINPVQISVDVNIPFTVDGQRFNKGVLTGQAFITGKSYGVLIEHEYTFGIGTLEKFVMKDKISFNVHLVGLQGMVDNLQNSVPTVQKIADGPNCVTDFTRMGTGTLNIESVGQIAVFTNPVDKTVHVGVDAQAALGGLGLVLPIIHTVCTGVAPGTNELPIAFIGIPDFEFNDSGQQQVIDQSVTNNKLKITVTPL